MGDCLGDCFQLCEPQLSLSLARSVVTAAASLLPLFALSFVGEIKVKQSLVSVLSQSLHSVRLSAVVVAAYVFYFSAGDLQQLGRACAAGDGGKAAAIPASYYVTRVHFTE